MALSNHLIMSTQVYEQYWSYTAAFTDLFGKKAISTLKICVEFLDVHRNILYSKDLYEELQEDIQDVLCIDLISIRKAINQFVKLGFLKPFLAGYPPETKEFLAASSSIKRKSILSRIVYKYADFDNSMTSPVYNKKRQINFILKTLEEIGHLSERELTAMMLVDIDNYSNGFLSPVELSQHYRTADANGFIERKYNQISHLRNLLSKLDDLITRDGVIYFETDAKRLFGNDLENKKIIKEPYLQRVYNCELIDESKAVLGSLSAESMITGTTSSVLVPAHIKPIIKSNEDEAFDVNNGLLVTGDTGNLFEKGFITIDTDGSILPSVLLSEDMHQRLSHSRLNPQFMNEKRMDYLEYHRHQVFADR